MIKAMIVGAILAIIYVVFFEEKDEE